MNNSNEEKIPHCYKCIQAGDCIFKQFSVGCMHSYHPIQSKLRNHESINSKKKKT